MPVTDLPDIQQDMIRYGTVLCFGLGLVGNICNCIMFTRQLPRRGPSSIYFLYLSIFSTIYLFWSVTPLLYSLNYGDPQTQSVVYCKLRLYGIHVLGQYLRYAVVFACADRFFASHSHARFRQLSSVRIAIKLLFLMTIGWPIVGIHLPVLMDLRGGVCEIIGSYKLVYAIYQITLVGIFPPVLMIIFSALTIRRLHQRHERHTRAKQRDRNLLRMVIAEVLINVITSIPFSLNLVYGGIGHDDADKSARRLEIEAFLSFVTHFLIYFISVAPFYLFLVTSEPFRKEFIKLLIQCWCKSTLRQGQGNPSYERKIATIHLEH
jgi:hypothetical protein